MYWIPFSIVLLGATSVGLAGPPTPLTAIAVKRPCSPSAVSLDAYLHGSRHGWWISDNADTSGAWLRVQFVTNSNSAGVAQALAFVRNPRDFRNNTFFARLSGSTKCDVHGSPVLHVSAVGNIHVLPIRKEN